MGRSKLRSAKKAHDERRRFSRHLPRTPHGFAVTGGEARVMFVGQPGARSKSLANAVTTVDRRIAKPIRQCDQLFRRTIAASAERSHLKESEGACYGPQSS